MKKEPVAFLEHILQSTNFILEDTKQYTQEMFKKDRKTQNAVVLNLLIIGEAAKGLPDSFREKYPHLPWPQMVRTRDKLIHGYFGIDLDIIWDVIQNDLPSLKKEIEKIIKENS